jgi:hypothetical protein
MVDAGLVVRHRAMMKKDSDGRVKSIERPIGAMRLPFARPSGGPPLIPIVIFVPVLVFVPILLRSKRVGEILS